MSGNGARTSDCSPGADGSSALKIASPNPPMPDTNDRQHRTLLRKIARRVMIERGLVPDFSPQALAELDKIQGPAAGTEDITHDLRHLPWCSIDNDDSRDLDQLTVAEAMADDAVKV